MPIKLQPKHQIKHLADELINTINEYKNSADYNGCDDEIELERMIDNLLCNLPRDIVYVEWFDRSDIKNMADGVYDEPADEDLVDMCMEDLDRFNGSIMENETVEYIVADTVRQHKREQTTCCDFCGCELHDNEYDDDGETIMCKTCQESGKFGHYNTNKGGK